MTDKSEEFWTKKESECNTRKCVDCGKDVSHYLRAIDDDLCVYCFNSDARIKSRFVPIPSNLIGSR